VGVVGVTGATGFIGSCVLSELIRAGATVRPIVRNPDRLGDQLRNPQVEAVVLDDLFSASEAQLIEATRGLDTLIHLAWFAQPGEYLHSPRNIGCLTGTIRLAHCFAVAGGRRFVGIGTCLEYQASDHAHAPDSPLRPETLYGACKTGAYESLRHQFNVAGVEFVWARLFYLYGVGEDERRLVPYIRHQLELGQAVELTSGTQVRDYMDVEQAAREIVALAHAKATGPLNVCSGVPLTVRQIAEGIADEFGRRDLLKFGARVDNPGERPFVVGKSWRLSTDC